MQIKVIVTGASGFIGGKIVWHLHAGGFDVQAWGRRKTLAEGHLPAGVEYRSFDLNEPIPNIDSDWVIHCAGLASHTAGKKALFDANVAGTRNVLEACSVSASFIFISSGSVYPAKSNRFTESDAHELTNLPEYGKTKLQAEQVCQEYKSRLKNLFILRPRAVYGPGDNQLLPRLKNLVKGSCFLLPGKGKNQISMCHIDNLCASAEKIIQSGLQGCFTWNVCDAEPYELAKILRPLLEKEKSKPLKFIHLPTTPLFAWAYLAKIPGIKSTINLQSLQYITLSVQLDSSKIREELGFEAKKSFWNYINDQP